MTEKQKLTLLKLLAVSAAGYYLYHLTKATGGTMQGRVNSERLAHLGAQLFPQEYRPHVKQFGTAVIDRMLSNV